MIARESELAQTTPGVFSVPSPGYFSVGWHGTKLRILGWVEPSENEVFISLNGAIVAVTRASPSKRKPGKNGYRIAFGASVLKQASARLEVRVSSRLGMLRTRKGATSATVDSPLGVETPTLIAKLAAGWTIDKWGQIALPISEKADWKGQVMRRYARVRDLLDDRFGLQAFLVAGTLLGVIREGDLIAHDDDFDAGYFSKETVAEAVRDEMFAIVATMREMGWRAHPAHTGRFIQVGPKSSKIDLFPAWHENDHVWMPNSQMMPAGADLMSPAKPGKFLGHKVWLPNQPEAYLALHYGETWRIPDKHYREVKKPGVMEGIRRVQLTEDQRAILRDTPIAKRVKSTD